MKRQKNNHRLALILTVAILFGLVLLSFLIVQSSQKRNLSQTQQAQLVSYTSEDLKIILNYPKNWYLDNRYSQILLTDYQTNLNRNDSPAGDQIKILISNFTSGCTDNLDENLMDPACKQDGVNIKKNEILSKEIIETNGGIFYVYTIKFNSGTILNYYILESSDRILQITKQPDPSRYEEEFEAIINSIEFL